MQWPCATKDRGSALCDACDVVGDLLDATKVYDAVLFSAIAATRSEVHQTPITLRRSFPLL